MGSPSASEISTPNSPPALGIFIPFKGVRVTATRSSRRLALSFFMTDTPPSRTSSAPATGDAANHHGQVLCNLTAGSDRSATDADLTHGKPFAGRNGVLDAETRAGNPAFDR